MSTITKLNYLADTKDELKDKLNEHGANITDNDTFRSYVDKIKGIYNNWPKVTAEGTELSLSPTRKGKMKLDLKGNTEQASYTGKNLFNPTETWSSFNGTNCTINNQIIKWSGTTTRGVSKKIANTNIHSGTYTITLETINGSHTSGKKIWIDFYNVDTKIESSSWSSDGSITKTFNTDVTRINLGFDNEDTFNNYEFRLQIEAGTQATSYEPYVGGQPSPSPDYPQDIHVVTGNNNVGVTGKNLFSLDNIQENGTGRVSYEIENNKIIISATSGGTYRFISKQIDNLVIGQEYSVKIGTYKDTSTNKIAQWGITKSNGSYYDVVQKLSSSQQITIIPTETSISFRAGYLTNSCTSGDTLTLGDIQLEEGSTATSYVPYYHQDYPLNLGSIELCKIGDCQDYLYKENGNWYKYGAIGKVVLDGTEENINYQSTYQRINIPFNLQTQDWGLLAFTLCNYYTIGNTETVDGSFNITRTTLMFKNNSLNSLNEWKTWLSTHNTSVYYILDTRIITQITDTTLIEQLEAIYNAMSTEETTNISQTNTDLPFIINATALKKGGN